MNGLDLFSPGSNGLAAPASAPPFMSIGIHFVKRMTINTMRFSRILIDPKGMVRAMFALGNEMKILGRIVQAVLIDVVNIMSSRNWAIMKFPNISVQHRPTTLGFTVIPIIAKSVSRAIESNERQWRWTVAKLPAPCFQQFMNGLTRHPECLSDLRQAVPLLIETIHFISLFVFSLPHHVLSLADTFACVRI